jgi:four helix bundle protein
MSRDHRKLRVFTLADQLTIEVYKATDGSPVSKRYELQSQLRRATVSCRLQKLIRTLEAQP